MELVAHPIPVAVHLVATTGNLILALGGQGVTDGAVSLLARPEDGGFECIRLIYEKKNKKNTLIKFCFKSPWRNDILKGVIVKLTGANGCFWR